MSGWADVTESLRGKGYDEVAIAAAYGALVSGKTGKDAARVLEHAQAQLANPAMFEALLLEAQQARELQPVEKEAVDVEGR